MFSQPLSETFNFDFFKFMLSILEVLGIVDFSRRNVNVSDLFCDFVFSGDTKSWEFFKAKEILNNSIQKQLHGFLDTIDNHSGINRDIIEEFRNHILFLDKLHIGQGFLCLFDSLVESIFSTISNIDNLNDLCLQTRIKHLSCAQFILEFTTSCQD